MLGRVEPHKRGFEEYYNMEPKSQRNKEQLTPQDAPMIKKVDGGDDILTPAFVSVSSA